MAKPKITYLIVFAVFTMALNVALYTWNQSLKESEVPYLVNNPVDRVAFDGQGQVWVYGGGKLSVYKDGVLIQDFTKKDTPALGGIFFELAVDNKGRALIVKQEETLVLGVTIDLAVFDGTKWSTLLPISPAEGALRINAIAIDMEGRAWIGTENHGLYIIESENWKNYTVANSGLLSNIVECIVFDNKGRAWIGTRVGGLNIFDGKIWQSFTTKNSPLLGEVRAIAFDQQGRAWIASLMFDGGINMFDGENWASYPRDEGFSEIAVDGQGRVWAKILATDGIVIFDGKIQKYYFDPFFYDNSLGKLTTDGNGNIWIPNENGVVIIPPNSLQPISYAANILRIVITTNGLIYLTFLLSIVGLCVVLNVWRNIGFSLLGFPIYLGWIILFNSDLSPYHYYLFKQFNPYFFINPGVIGTIAGIVGGYLDILHERSGRPKRIRSGLTGFVIGSGLSFCFLLFIAIAFGPH
jgi:hypothetical protein